MTPEIKMKVKLKSRKENWHSRLFHHLVLTLSCPALSLYPSDHSGSGPERPFSTYYLSYFHFHMSKSYPFFKAWFKCQVFSHPYN